VMREKGVTLEMNPGDTQLLITQAEQLALK
jgi:hypothetical protein